MLVRVVLYLFVCTLMLAAQAVSPSDESSKDLEPMVRMLESQAEFQASLERRALRITKAAMEEMKTPLEWERARTRRLEELRDMLGLLPWPERTPLKAQITGVLDKGSYLVEKIAFQSMPGIYVTGNLYIPKQREGKLPAIVYVCGHSYSPHGDKTAYQRHGISFAKNGYVAFILDSIQIAETFALHHGVHSQDMFDWYARGYTPAGVEVWNAMRAIDYLETRPEVDPDRVGMTGRSGGAGMSIFTAAVDPRVKVVVPVMGISTYAANVKNNTQRLHCDCMFCINVHKHDMLHQGALIAPRPLLLAHGVKDDLFPVEGYREFARVMDQLYAGYGKSQEFQNIEVDTGHADSDFLREQAIRWFDQYLMRVPRRKLDLDYSNADPETLSVFGGNPPADAKNYLVHKTFTTRPSAEKYMSLSEWETRRAALMGTLHQLLPLDEGDDESLPRIDTDPKRDLTKKLPVLVYIASDGEDSSYQNLLLTGPPSQNEVVRAVVWPRGVGEIPWPRLFQRDALRNAMHVGETPDSLRLRDIRRALLRIQQMPGVDPARITVAGRGQSGVLGLYAAILEQSVHQVILMDPPESHDQGPLFLNILRHTDIPEAAALLAPRRLLFYGKIPKAYEYTQHVYALHGEEDKLSVIMHLAFAAAGQVGHGMASGR
jgi:cephalosporin-C deacetylase-like acetyl esterase